MYWPLKLENYSWEYSGWRLQYIFDSEDQMSKKNIKCHGRSIFRKRLRFQRLFSASVIYNKNTISVEMSATRILLNLFWITPPKPREKFYVHMNMF